MTGHQAAVLTALAVRQGSRLLGSLVKTSELLRMLAHDGWSRVRQSGSHAIYRHPTKAGQLTVPIHPGKEVPKGTAERLLKAAGIK